MQKEFILHKFAIQKNDEKRVEAEGSTRFIFYFALRYEQM